MSFSLRNPERLGAGATIPPMLHEMGRHWRQPDRSRITIDATHALMSQADFEALADYTTSQPSGVYEGKMWKSQAWKWEGDEVSIDRGYARRVMLGKWYLRWFGPSDKPGYCSNNVREIIIL